MHRPGTTGPSFVRKTMALTTRKTPGDPGAAAPDGTMVMPYPQVMPIVDRTPEPR